MCHSSAISINCCNYILFQFACILKTLFSSKVWLRSLSSWWLSRWFRYCFRVIGNFNTILFALISFKEPGFFCTSHICSSWSISQCHSLFDCSTTIFLWKFYIRRRVSINLETDTSFFDLLNNGRSDLFNAMDPIKVPEMNLATIFTISFFSLIAFSFIEFELISYKCIFG